MDPPQKVQEKKDKRNAQSSTYGMQADRQFSNWAHHIQGAGNTNNIGGVIWALVVEGPIVPHT